MYVSEFNLWCKDAGLDIDCIRLPRQMLRITNDIMLSHIWVDFQAVLGVALPCSYEEMVNFKATIASNVPERACKPLRELANEYKDIISMHKCAPQTSLRDTLGPDCEAATASATGVRKRPAGTVEVATASAAAVRKRPAGQDKMRTVRRRTWEGRPYVSDNLKGS